MAAEIRVLADADAVAVAAADLLVARASDPTRPVHIALSGGSTPRRAYALAPERLDDWSGVTLWLGDERVVPLEDERSNFRLATETLTAGLPPDRRPRIEPVRVEADLETAAAEYGRRLREGLGPDGRLQLALLGLGPDGHTASLFPGLPAVEITDRDVAGVPEAGLEPWVPRVTLTLPVFDAAEEVVFLVAGEEKAPVVARAFGPEPDRSLPSARVQPRSGRLVVLCDEAAASAL